MLALGSVGFSVCVSGEHLLCAGRCTYYVPDAVRCSVDALIASPTLQPVPRAFAATSRVSLSKVHGDGRQLASAAQLAADRIEQAGVLRALGPRRGRELLTHGVREKQDTGGLFIITDVTWIFPRSFSYSSG